MGMRTGRWLTLAVALSACVGVTAAEAAAKKATKAAAGPVARGCTHTVAPFCVGVTSRGTSYALFGQSPFIPTGIGVDVWGTVSGISPCGTSIQVTAWKRNKLKCRG
jgi:hypothetical protein